jgi:hypothetical protein
VRAVVPRRPKRGGIIKTGAFALALLIVCLPQVSDAQDHTPRSITITGVVQDLGDRPLRAAEIIASADVRTVTDTAGQFTLANVTPGSDIMVRRIGYQPQTFAIQTDSDVSGVSVKITLVPMAVSLGTMVIEGKKVDRQLWLNGFYKRQLVSFGVFFTPERLERTGASIATLMNEVPSLRVNHNRGTSTVLGRSASATTYCRMNVFLDGVFVPYAHDIGVDNVIGRDDVKAIEVYPRPLMVPAMIRGLATFQGGSTFAGTRVGGSVGGSYIECGAILIWSKWPNKPE